MEGHRGVLRQVQTVCWERIRGGIAAELELNRCILKANTLSRVLKRGVSWLDGIWERDVSLG